MAVPRVLLTTPETLTPYNITPRDTNHCAEFSSLFGCLDDFSSCNSEFGLSPAGYGFCYSNYAEQLVIMTTTHSMAWTHSRGSQSEKEAVVALQFIALALAILILFFYGYSFFRATCGWEEVYVCCVELVFVSIEISHEFDSPATVYLSTGNHAYMLRYAEWLLSCPVILIHLSNLSGMKNDYSKRTMRLLVSCIGMIVFGMYGGLSTGWLKWVLTLISFLYSALLYSQAAKCYVESYVMVPKGTCRWIVRAMAYIYFATWGTYPILFVIGPEGLQMLSPYANAIAHTICDIFAKEIWTLLGHILRIKIHEHIIIHGDIRKKTKLKIGGDEVEVDEFVDEDDADGVKQSGAALANRNSFVIMRDRLKAQGADVRLSLGGGPTVNIAPGRIILAVPDYFFAQMFQMQWQQLPRLVTDRIELVPAIGVDTTLQLAKQAQASGGCDFVLMHPELMRSGDIVNTLRALGIRVVAFGPAYGPMKDLIDNSGADAFIEGPPVNPDQLERIIGDMQASQRAMAMTRMLPPAAAEPYRSYEPLLPLQKTSMGQASINVPATPSGPGSVSGGADAELVNQLMAQINSLKSELQTPNAPAPAPASPAPAAATTSQDADLVNQLMSQINSLKNELFKS